MEYVAGASGATLGYIAGNIPGAYYGYKAGKALYRGKMAYGKRKRSRSSGMKYGNSKKRKYSAKKNYVSGKALTLQHDAVVQYRKKSMPKGKKVAWKKFVQKVSAVNLRDRGLITALFNRSCSFEAILNTQAYLAAHLYGYNGSQTFANGEPGLDDMKQLLFDNQSLRGEEFFDTGGVDKQANGYKTVIEKIQFESAILDVTCVNTSTATLEVDCYYIEYNKFNKVITSALLPQLNAGNTSDVGLIQNGVGTATILPNITINDRGATPFEMGHILGRNGIKIIKKEKFYLSPAQAVNKQIRDSKNRYLDIRGLNTEGAETSANSPGCYKYSNMTKTLLFVAKCVDSAVSAKFKLGITRTYKYSYEGLKDNKNYFRNI